MADSPITAAQIEKIARNGTKSERCGLLLLLAGELRKIELHESPLRGKYADVLVPFAAMMEAELHANSGKGDRPGWLAMDRKTALLEILYHLAKLQKATKDNDLTGIREHSADVANMSMMLADICGVLEVPMEQRA